MEKLYALISNGITYYFFGDIPDSLLTSVNSIAQQTNIFSDRTEDPSSIFCKIVKDITGINLTPINISYIFRSQ